MDGWMDEDYDINGGKERWMDISPPTVTPSHCKVKWEMREKEAVNVHASAASTMGGGAWPFLVGGAICLVNSDNLNERDLRLLNRAA